MHVISYAPITRADPEEQDTTATVGKCLATICWDGQRAVEQVVEVIS